MRAGVVLIQGDRIALIERSPVGERYYLLPGGTVDEGESCEEAARREAAEELGLDVAVGCLVATVTVVRGGDVSVQRYFVARSVGGTFGTGTGEEIAAGGYRAVWLALGDCGRADVRPAAVVAAVAERGIDDLVRRPLVVSERKDY